MQAVATKTLAHKALRIGTDKPIRRHMYSPEQCTISSNSHGIELSRTYAMNIRAFKQPFAAANCLLQLHIFGRPATAVKSNIELVSAPVENSL